MYIHVGSDRSVPGSALIFILDAGLADTSPVTREWFGARRAAGRVADSVTPLVRAWVVTDDLVLLAPVTPATLVQRADRPWS